MDERAVNLATDYRVMYRIDDNTRGKTEDDLGRALDESVSTYFSGIVGAVVNGFRNTTEDTAQVIVARPQED